MNKKEWLKYSPGIFEQKIPPWISHQLQVKKLVLVVDQKFQTWNIKEIQSNRLVPRMQMNVNNVVIHIVSQDTQLKWLFIFFWTSQEATSSSMQSNNIC